MVEIVLGSIDLLVVGLVLGGCINVELVSVLVNLCLLCVVFV